MAPNVSKMATVTHTAPKAVPILSEGQLTPLILTDWKNSCHHFFIERDIPDDKMVTKVTGGLQDPLIHDWYLTQNRALSTLSWKDFCIKMRKKWLPRDWKRHLKHEIYQSHQKPSESWSNWTVGLEKMNIALRDTTAHIAEAELRTLFEANACEDLILCINDFSDTLVAIDDFDKWKDAIIVIDDMRMCEDAKILRTVTNHVNSRSGSGPSSRTYTNSRGSGKFMVWHLAKDCNEYPKAQGYKTLTLDDAKAAWEARTGKTFTVAYAAIDGVEIDSDYECAHDRHPR